MRNSELKFIVDVAAAFLDCVYMCYDVESPAEHPEGFVTDEYVASVLAHPLMTAELRRQDDDAKFLQGLAGKFDGRTVLSIRQRAKEQPAVLPRRSECKAPEPSFIV